MKPTNVASMDFTSAETMEEFIKMHQVHNPDGLHIRQPRQDSVTGFA